MATEVITEDPDPGYQKVRKPVTLKSTGFITDERFDALVYSHTANFDMTCYPDLMHPLPFFGDCTDLKRGMLRQLILVPYDSFTDFKTLSAWHVHKAPSHQASC